LYCLFYIFHVSGRSSFGVWGLRHKSNPTTAEQLAEIAISSADSSMAFGIEPKIAMLSYSLVPPEGRRG
jgi:hypothetical protein